MYGKNKIIKPAPPKEILKMYGGKVSDNDYRKNLITNEKKYNLVIPPLVSIIPQVEEIIVKRKQSNKVFLPINDFRIDKATKALKLRRTKSSKSKNTLENFMEIS